MSRKTEAIHKSLDELNELQEELVTLAEDLRNRQLEDISFKMSMQLKSLSFWIDSLYAQNGQSKSRLKTQASRENGKKGGRPPKEITQAKVRITELEEVVIPELQSRKRLADELFEEADLSIQERQAEEELAAMKAKVIEWEARKKQ